MQDFLPEPRRLHAAHQPQQQVHERRGADVPEHQADELVLLLQEHNHLDPNTPVSEQADPHTRETPPRLSREDWFGTVLRRKHGKTLKKLYERPLQGQAET